MSAASARTSASRWIGSERHLRLFVTFVGFLIHIFATGYMHGDTGFYRFFAYLNLFMFSMLTLVLGRQSAADVRRLGGRRALLLPADRLLH